MSSNVPVLYRCLYDVDVEDSEQFQKLQNWRNAQRHFLRRKPPSFRGIGCGVCLELGGALTVGGQADEYMLVNNVSSDSELGIYLVNKGITPFPDRFKPYINYARVGAEYREKHGGEYSSGNYVQKRHLNFWRTRDWTAFSGYGWKTPALFVYRAKQRRSLCLRPLSNWRAPDNLWEWTASIWRNSLGEAPAALSREYLLPRGWI